MDRGLRVLKNAARSFKKSEYAQWAMGQHYLELENFPSAFRFYSRAVKADAEAHRSLFGLAQSAFELGRYSIAFKNFELACRKDDKATLVPFRAAASRLRQNKNYDWMKKFDSGARMHSGG